ncbi:hypothetical protein [Mycolicibacterium brumae]|uniref:hypothetical protein n=1 Tax=Mycolicibacterium brumae TaxID=85968 RepID=UPI000A6F99B0|nr:hypothetical protein [Mycolicibacterium brumae]MCV7191872.1 hypothetical protein [Mycolicibacterium brumae]RWA15749.1 hypothetical protein MBRU_09360 [Mycolicibacterium brumae DSM 44177]UWW07178.1 YfjI family protein [Mycolicibacterium brumae]
MSDEFWTARPVLTHARNVARARGAGPWAVLGAAMANAVATIPPEIGLPGIVGGRMSLNLFIALTGPSGGGKGAAEAAARAGFKFTGDEIDVVPLGSGEGIARTYRPTGTKADDPNPVTTAVFSAPEIDTVAALASRSGATLSAELRKVYSGEQLGFANAGKDTRNVVAAGSYRACLIVGVQPAQSQTLLSASGGGLPQRFAWLPTSDPDAPDEAPEDPGTVKVSRPAWLRRVGGHVDLIVPDVARAEIRAHRLAVLREDPTVDPLNGHSLLTRLKIAAALMALDGRTVIGDEDWALAGIVMAVSDHTRARCQRALDEQSRRVNTARALASVERDEIAAERKAQRARDAILRRIDNRGQQTRAQLSRVLKMDIRDYLDPALADLLDRGEIRVSPAMLGNRKGHVYHRDTLQKQVSTSGNDTCPTGTRVPKPGDMPQRKNRPARQRTRGKYSASQQTGEAAS